jgi:hypothetical protein
LVAETKTKSKEHLRAHIPGQRGVDFQSVKEGHPAVDKRPLSNSYGYRYCVFPIITPLAMALKAKKARNGRRWTPLLIADIP